MSDNAENPGISGFESHKYDTPESEPPDLGSVRPSTDRLETGFGPFTLPHGLTQPEPPKNPSPHQNHE